MSDGRETVNAQVCILEDNALNTRVKVDAVGEAVRSGSLDIGGIRLLGGYVQPQRSERPEGLDGESGESGR